MVNKMFLFVINYFEKTISVVFAVFLLLYCTAICFGQESYQSDEINQYIVFAASVNATVVNAIKAKGITVLDGKQGIFKTTMVLLPNTNYYLLNISAKDADMDYINTTIINSHKAICIRNIKVLTNNKGLKFTNMEIPKDLYTPWEIKISSEK